MASSYYLLWERWYMSWFWKFILNMSWLPWFEDAGRMGSKCMPSTLQLMWLGTGLLVLPLFFGEPLPPKRVGQLFCVLNISLSWLEPSNSTISVLEQYSLIPLGWVFTCQSKYCLIRAILGMWSSVQLYDLTLHLLILGEPSYTYFKSEH
jgi:hypothetical protein